MGGPEKWLRTYVVIMQLGRIRNLWPSVHRLFQFMPRSGRSIFELCSSTTFLSLTLEVPQLNDPAQNHREHAYELPYVYHATKFGVIIKCRSESFFEQLSIPQCRVRSGEESFCPVSKWWIGFERCPESWRGSVVRILKALNSEEELITQVIHSMKKLYLIFATLFYVHIWQ